MYPTYPYVDIVTPKPGLPYPKSKQRTFFLVMVARLIVQAQIKKKKNKDSIGVVLKRERRQADRKLRLHFTKMQAGDSMD